MGRVNMHNNLFIANLVVSLTQALNMAGNYMTGFLHFGLSAAQQSGRLGLTQAVFFNSHRRDL